MQTWQDFDSYLDDKPCSYRFLILIFSGILSFKKKGKLKKIRLNKIYTNSLFLRNPHPSFLLKPHLGRLGSSQRYFLNFPSVPKKYPITLNLSKYIKKPYSRCSTLRASSVSVSDFSWLERAGYRKHAADSVHLFAVYRSWEQRFFLCSQWDSAAHTGAFPTHTSTGKHNPVCRFKSQCEGRTLYTLFTWSPLSHVASAHTHTHNTACHVQLESCDHVLLYWVISCVTYFNWTKELCKGFHTFYSQLHHKLWGGNHLHPQYWFL